MSPGLPGVSGVWGVKGPLSTIKGAPFLDPGGFLGGASTKLRLRCTGSRCTTTLVFSDRLLFRVTGPDLTGFNSIRGCGAACWVFSFLCLGFLGFVIGVDVPGWTILDCWA